MAKQEELPIIDLGFKLTKDCLIDLNDKELFNTTANIWADAIKKTKKTQVRNFYDKILELEKQIERDSFESVYPFIKMLNSKVAYGVNRKVVSKEFQKMMTQCLDQIRLKREIRCKENINIDEGEQIFKHFKLFFEAVLGFFKERGK